MQTMDICWKAFEIEVGITIRPSGKRGERGIINSIQERIE